MLGHKQNKNTLDKILDEENPKTWEIRSSDTKVRGEIWLLQTKDKRGEEKSATSGMVRGKSRIVETILLGTRNKLSDLKAILDANQHFHRMDYKDILRTLKYKRAYAWVLKDSTPVSPRNYENPIGAIKWIRNVRIV